MSQSTPVPFANPTVSSGFQISFKTFFACLIFALFPFILSAQQGVPCKEDVDAQLREERSELQSLLAKHFSGARVDGRIYGLPQDDFDDPSNITVRQRQWYRAMNPHMPPHGGGVQYPRWVYDLMNRLDYAGATVCADGTILFPDSPVPFSPDAPIVLSNINVTNDSAAETETYLAIDPTGQQYMVGGSNNNITGGGGQKMYRSSDYGSTWTTGTLTPARTYHSDPGVNFDSAGNVYTNTLDYTSSLTQVKFYKSTNHGATWPTQLIVDDSNSNDKQLAAIDTQSTSACKDQIYIGWHTGGTEYATSTTAPNSGIFRAKTAVQTTPATPIGCDLAVGPPASPGANAPVYYIWANTSQLKINFSKSTNCGASWSAYSSPISTVDGYDYGIPAMCTRRALIYPSIDVDRSSGPRRGWIYASWNDFTATQSSGCVAASSASNANVWLSRSTDGGSSWSAPVKVHGDPANTDQFNQWMKVDDADGTIHVMWHDTRNDPNRKMTDIYYTRSTDGGITFDPEMKVTTAMTDESNAGANGNQYGDYEGLAVLNGVIYPFWTDRRTSSGTDEEVYTAKICSEPKSVGGVTFADSNACSQSGVQVSWSAPSIFWGDGGQGTRKYQLYVDGSLATDNISSAATSVSYSPGNSASHSYSIRAVNSCNNFSAYTASAGSDASDITPPSTSGWNSIRGGHTGGTANWSWGSIGGAASYNVYRDTIANSPWAPAQKINVSPIVGTSYSDTPPAGTIFFYQFRALDSCGNEG